jgi:hypothetical protein
VSIARSKYWATRPKSLVADGPWGIYCVVVESDADTSVFDRGGELVEGALGDVNTLAIAVVEVELLLKFFDSDHD